MTQDEIQAVALKPCPFCGNDGSGPIEHALHVSHTQNDWHSAYDCYSVQCDKCTVSMGYSDNEAEAIAAWNTRADAAPTPKADEVEAVARAIKSASCPGREGPFGGYDYGHNEAFYGPAPEGGRYVIRDYRDPSSPDWGAWLHQTNDRDEHEAKFAKMTDDHVAQAVIAALDAARGDPVARVVEWLRKDADQTEIEAGHIVKNSSGNPRKNAAEWAMLVAMKRGLADAIERGEPFNG